MPYQTGRVTVGGVGGANTSNGRKSPFDEVILVVTMTSNAKLCDVVMMSLLAYITWHHVMP